jgi:hypothetical protein
MGLRRDEAWWQDAPMRLVENIGAFLLGLGGQMVVDGIISDLHVKFELGLVFCALGALLVLVALFFVLRPSEASTLAGPTPARPSEASTLLYSEPCPMCRSPYITITNVARKTQALSCDMCGWTSPTLESVC